MSNLSASGASFVQVPPQSSGKKVATEFRGELFVRNITDLSVAQGDIITGATSGATAEISGVELNINGADVGIYYLRHPSGTFVNNENLLISGIPVAVADMTNHEYQQYDIQKVVITDPNNLTYQQKIDRFGATVNTFTDGSPLFGPFGTMMVGEPVTIRDYTFNYSNHDPEFWDQTIGAGTIGWESRSVSCLLTTGTANGDLASRTSNYYHKYSPGTGTLIEQTCQIGDPGKTNCVRRWGYYDDDNGFFWELDGTQLNFVMRSNSGNGSTVVETRVPREEWTIDKLDGSNSINFDLDVTKGNIYWIDFQWLGAGRIRFGVIEPGGARLTAHVIQNANTNSTYPYMRTATLPIRFEQFNTGTVASSSEFRTACSVVKNTEAPNISGQKRTVSTDVKTIADTDGEVIIGAIRPKQVYGSNSDVNRIISRVKSFNLANMAAGSFVEFKTHATDSAALVAAGMTFNSVADDSSMEFSINQVPHIPLQSAERVSFLLGPEETRYHQEIINTNQPTVEIYLGANSTFQPALFVTAKVVKGTSADVFMSLNWEEEK